MKKVILFDFDGTLADTLDALVKITNYLSREYGYPPVHSSEIHQLKNLSSWQIVKRSGLSIFQIPFLIRRVRSEFQHHLQWIQLFPGIQEALWRLKEQGYLIYILTSNSQNNVTTVFKNHQILDLVNGIYSSSNLFGKHKKIKTILQKVKVSPEQAIYVGDETRDIVAAQNAKIKVIAVTWGFNTKAVLAEHQPNAFVDQPQDLLKVIPTLFQKESSSQLSQTLMFNSLPD